MSSTDQNTPTGKPGRRKGKKEKSRKPDQAMSPQPDQPEETIEPIGAIVAPPEPAPVDPAPIEAAPIEAAAAADAAPVGAAEPADVEADGSFKKTITIDREGYATLVIKAVDASGNETVKPVKVFVESL